MTELEKFYSDLSWNHVFYGVALNDGTLVWSSSLADVLNYKGRVAGNVIKSTWGKVRETMLAAEKES